MVSLNFRFTFASPEDKKLSPSNMIKGQVDIRKSDQIHINIFCN